jgi:hypothetical protein
MEVLMNAFRHFLSIFTLSLSLFTPQATAMSAAGRSAARAMSNARSALNQTGRSAANTAARDAAVAGEVAESVPRRVTPAPGIAQPTRQSMTPVRELPEPVRQPITENLSRSFATQAPKAAQTAPNQGAGLGEAVAAGVGIAGLMGAAAYEKSQETSLPKDFLIETDTIMLIRLMRENPDYARQFAQLVTVENLAAIDVAVLRFIVHTYPAAAKKITAISQSIDRGRFSEFVEQAKKSKNPTPTELHLAQYDDIVQATFGKEFDMFPGFRKVVKNVIALEKEYAPKDYYTFVHAQRWSYDFTEAIYRRLKESALNAELPEFKFLVTKSDYCTTRDEEERMRKQIIEQKVEVGDENAKSRQLFLNSSFFGNTSSKGLGSSSVYYFYMNKNCSKVKASPSYMFRMYGQEALYEKYAAEFDELEKEHEALSKGYGNIIFIAVPKSKISDFVAQVVPGGYVASSIVNGKNTNDIRVILDALSTDPSKVEDSDKKEFVLAMTYTAGLDPKSGIKVYSINAVDPKAYAAWQQKFDALMTKITPEFKDAYEKYKQEIDERVAQNMRRKGLHVSSPKI